jgi:hypothetical protein
MYNLLCLDSNLSNRLKKADMKAIEIYSFAQAALLQLPSMVRREMGRRLSVIAADKHRSKYPIS